MTTTPALLMACVIWAGLQAGPLFGPRAATPMAATQPPSSNRGPVLFEPGVWLDWQRREVRVAARVVLRAGALEFLACGPGKEHESILRWEAQAAHVYMALGLIGLLPGQPPTYEPRSDAYVAPAGDRVAISLEWELGGEPRVADAFDWLREVEYQRAPLSRTWVFTGSLRGADGTLAADVTGAGIALVDFPDSLLALSQRHTSRNAELWAEAHAPAIPPEGTAVWLLLRPAAFHPCELTLDFRGDLWLDGRYCVPADAADVLLAARQLNPTHVQTIAVRGALPSDAACVRRALLEAGLPAGAVSFRSAARGTTLRAAGRGCGD